MRPLDETNILILGETGVGKTTWINGFANYLTFETLDEASRPSAPLVCPIPTKFYITDENYKRVTIQVGESKNECFEEGRSATQEPVAHTFYVGDRLVRLIDTPGVGDVAGVERDQENFQKILRYIANYKELHGVCILLKPNNARLNLTFKYCINELLTQLHRRAADNIVFCFTNTRGTFYKPGDTMTPLTAYLTRLKKDTKVEIALSKHTVYCMDNEAFRFLCCVKNDVRIEQNELNNFSVSWQQAEAESQRLFKHFTQLKPHQLNDSVSLNRARSNILMLARPLAQTKDLIVTNMAHQADKIKEIELLDTKDKNFQSLLYIERVGFKQTPLDYPQTVCTASKCVATKPIINTGANQTVYTTICHSPCTLTSVTPERVPHPDLQRCYAIWPSGNLTCTHCGCKWDLHMHITFSQEQVTETIEDEAVRQAIIQNRTAKEIQETALETHRLVHIFR